MDAVWTYGDIEAISPGWHACHIKGWPEDADEAANRLAQFQDDVVRGDRGEDIGLELCSPYEGPGLFRPLHELSDQGDHMIPRLATVLGGPPRSDFVIPDGLDPLLMLALAGAARPSRRPAGDAVALGDGPSASTCTPPGGGPQGRPVPSYFTLTLAVIRGMRRVFSVESDVAVIR